MNPVRIIVALVAALSLSACGGLDTATRNAPLEAQTLTQTPAVAAGQAVQVVDFQIRVPPELKASEANLYFPGGDIVWRGDAPGDRHVQVAAIFDTAMRSAIPAVSGATPVVADIELVRFHALTEKARYTVGGVHSIKFMLTLKDPETGAVIAAPRLIEASLRAYGGSKAIEADRRGLGEKVRISRHLTNVLATELTRPGAVGKGITDYVVGLENGPLKL